VRRLWGGTGTQGADYKLGPRGTAQVGKAPWNEIWGKKFHLVGSLVVKKKNREDTRREKGESEGLKKRSGHGPSLVKKKFSLN